ncbi:MAG: hypothetical protein JST19_08490 [Bacteroidetes bacterium]|nr:hypothetical protein [Bacteroidota bacterium]
MKKEKDQEVDELFKKGLHDPVNEPAFRESDWDAMERMLSDGRTRRGIIYWLPVAIGAAALLLLFIGWFLFRAPNSGNGQQNHLSAKNHAAKGTLVTPQNDSGSSGGPAGLAADSSKQKIQTPADYAVNPKTPGNGQNKSFFSLSPGAGRRHTGVTGEKKELGTADDHAKAPAELTAAVTGEQKINPAGGDKKDLGSADGHINDGSAVIALVPGKPNDNAQPGNKKDAPGAIANTTTTPAVIADVADGKRDKGLSKTKKDLGTADFRKPIFALTAIASSDMNGVNSFGGRLGGNFGGMFSATFGQKWTITTGGMYSIKPYSTPFDNYHTVYHFNVQPSSVNANCRMIDIPLNVNYQVYAKNGNRFTLGTGLSSYIILREDYHFNYDPAAGGNYYNNNVAGPAGYTVINKNRNIFGIMNLDATYERQISPRMGIMVQPYLKIPLSNVGASQAKLQSTGVALGLSWDINSFRKPK